jgi:hypothetical protein
MAKKEIKNSMEFLSSMKLVELKEIAPSFKVIITKEMKKADIIKAIFESKLNILTETKAAKKSKSVKVVGVKEDIMVVFTRPKKVRKRKVNFQ